MRRAGRALALVAGLLTGGWLLWQYGADLATQLPQLSAALPGVFLASAAIYALDTLGWKLTFDPRLPGCSLWQLFCVRMAGEAINKVTPLASMGGEPLKAYLLRKYSVSLGDGLASVAVAKNVMTLAQISFVFCGVGVGLFLMPQEAGLLFGLATFPALVMSAILVTAGIDHRIRRRRRGESTHEADEVVMNPMVRLWSKMADFYWLYPRHAVLSFLWFFLGWAMGAVELLAGAYVLGIPLTWQRAVVMEAMLVGVNMATFFIPANAGSQEGGFAFLAPIMGMATPQGVALGLLRRLRDLVWVAFGLAYLAATEGAILVKPPLETSEGTAG